MHMVQQSPMLVHVRRFMTIMMALRKGGVGKTTMSVNLAVFLAALGFHIVIIDGDSQRNASALSALRDLDTNELRDRIYSQGTFKDAILGQKTLRDVIYQVRKNLWVIPADDYLDMGRYHILAKKDFDVISRLLDGFSATLDVPPSIIERFPYWEDPHCMLQLNAFQMEHTTAEEFYTPPSFVDFVFMDTPPKEGDELVVAMTNATDKIIIPTELGDFAIQGMNQLVRGLDQQFADRRKKPEIIGIIPNRVQHVPRSPHFELDYLRSIWRYFPQFAMKPVHFDVALSDAQTLHVTTLEYVRNRKLTSRATREIADIALSLAGFKGKVAGVQKCDFCIRAAQEGFALYQQDHAQQPIL